ncbi:hypothetical protein ABIB38_000890 [Massilia sp. UYP11]|uniref:exopolysaccharide biosynthesis protein n=1 Tax=Massilia sp. UYP11 TaxID=1756385 RepID=UPI003D234E1E
MKLIDQLRTLPERLHAQRPQLREILATLGESSAALVLLLFSLPAIVPTPGVPAGMLFGSLLTLVGLQMTLGILPIRIPPGLSGLRIEHATLHRVIARTVPYLEKSERWIRPRLSSLVTPFATRAIGLVICVMGVLIALPIPFGNTVPGLAVLLLALGLGQRDGVAILVGMVLALVACATSWGLLAGSWWVIERFFLPN